MSPKRTGTILPAILAALFILSSCTGGHTPSELRPSAYPLITIDPYISAWSASDNLNESEVRHWTGRKFPLTGTLTVDGTGYRFLGVSVREKQVILPTGEMKAWPCRYTPFVPKGKWMEKDYSENRLWKKGKGSFGYLEPDAVFRTEWLTNHIWIRREFNLDQSYEGRDVYLNFSHDDDATIWINGKKVVEWNDSYECGGELKIPEEIAATLQPGRNVIAATCWNRSGDGIIDFGLSCVDTSGDAATRIAEQRSADVQATQTHYRFTCGPVDLDLTFTAPLLPDNLELVSRPVNYISYAVRPNDGKSHEVGISFEADAAWATDKAAQKATAELSAESDDRLVYLKAGTDTQEILGKKGDAVCIDWGYFYLAAGKKGTEASTENGILRLDRNLGKVRRSSSGMIMAGYDDIFSIEYFGDYLRPYWNRTGEQTIQQQFLAAEKQYRKVMKACDRFDRKLMEDAEVAGGRKYAELCALAYRQAMAAHKLVESPDGEILWLSKENDSNGSIGTVDVTYPSSPLFLLYNPELAKGLLNHIYHYAESGKWTKPFPAHDVGTYPVANGQTYEGDMPVEEAGNVLILTDAICHFQDDYLYAERHWNTLTTWAEYLEQFGLDPENQLCTDDFAGRSAHNTNLSIKAILALKSYSDMAENLGHPDIAARYDSTSRAMAARWVEMADAGDHFSRTFGNRSNWSQKYNLVWDKILGFNIFPKEVAEKELAFYPSVELEYGLPLDDRRSYTKTDWIVWTATLSDDRAEFEHLIDGIYRFQNETQDRVPMSDWVWTDKAEHVAFKARSVVGGYFIKMLEL